MSLPFLVNKAIPLYSPASVPPTCCTAVPLPVRPAVRPPRGVRTREGAGGGSPAGEPPALRTVCALRLQGVSARPGLGLSV